MSTVDLTSRQIPAWIQELLGSPPTAGAGIHWWLYRCACALAPWRTAEEIHGLLLSACSGCARKVTAHELNDAVKRRQCNWEPDGLSAGTRLMTTQFRSDQDTGPRWPKPDWQAIAKIAGDGLGRADLWEASPIRIEGDIVADEYIETLFPGDDPLLCMARGGAWDAVTRPWSDWKAIQGAPGNHGLIVPTMMSAPTGINQEGEVTARSLDNTAKRQYLVAEFDFQRAKENKPRGPVDDLLDSLAAERYPRAAPDICAGILLHLLGLGAPLLLAVFSGSKSLHGWFPTYGAEDEALIPFFKEARRLGADGATWCKAQMVRLPEGTRSDGRRQTVHFWNPSLLKAA